ncbi:MAG: tRNA (adenosine(37)-N6)-threonylcarbamoyltransferase complex dimerization subunit type 1 TsaB [Planctomycetota bacterium]
MQTAGGEGAVAIAPLGGDGEAEAARVFLLPAKKRHNLELMPTIDAAARELGLSPAGLREACVSLGPGSFTGVRAGAACVQMFAAADPGLRVVGVGEADVVAQAVGGGDGSAVAVVMSVKRGDAWCGLFAGGAWAIRCEDRPVEGFVDAVREYTAGLGEHGPVRWACDPGAMSGGAGVGLPDGFASTAWPDADSRALALLHLGRAGLGRGEATPADRLLPIYGRAPEAVALWKAQGRSTPGN